ncbi:SAF domain-containing protein [Penicillium herquei]|nr:SAF domain-containing protein [Penicillium herquei]
MSNLSMKLAQLEAIGKPIQVGIIGAGKFGSMYISQSHRTTGVRLACIADLSVQRALDALKRTGFPEEKYDTEGILTPADGIKENKTTITTNAEELISTPGIDVVLEVTGNPAAGVRHALLCCEHKKHIVMINVEADVLAGPLLTRKAKEAGIIYSMAYGDQPALIAEMVDWARTAGFLVALYTKEQLASGDFNPQMFNSFLDGTKSALEMAAVANGCGLSPPTNGLAFPPCGTHDLPNVLKPISEGGQLEKYGTVEVVSCLEKDGRAVFNDLRWGVYYGLKTDKSGRFAAQYKPYHLIGLELGISIASIMCRGEPTGQCRTFAADVAATAKRDLKRGEKLDGEGGFMAYGKLMPARNSLAIGGFPIGLAHGIILKEDIKKDQVLTWADVDVSPEGTSGWSESTRAAVAFRQEMEGIFRGEFESGNEVMIQ